VRAAFRVCCGVWVLWSVCMHACKHHTVHTACASQHGRGVHCAPHACAAPCAHTHTQHTPHVHPPPHTYNTHPPPPTLARTRCCQTLPSATCMTCMARRGWQQGSASAPS
jgi:hypothetical protein